MKLSSLFAFSDFKVLESVFRRRNKGIRTPNGVNPNRGSEILSVRNPPQEHELKENGTRSRTGGILSVGSQPSSSSSRSSSACGRGGFQFAPNTQARLQCLDGFSLQLPSTDSPFSISHPANHNPGAPSGLSGRSPSMTFRITIMFIDAAKGALPLSTS